MYPLRGGERPDHHPQHAHQQPRELGRPEAFRISVRQPQPGHDAQDHGQIGTLGGGGFPVNARGERHESGDEGDLVGVLHHGVNAHLIAQREEDDADREGHHYAAHGPELVFVALERHEHLEDVLGESGRGRENGAAGGGHDGGEQRAEEHDLGKNGRVLEDEGRQDELGIFLEQLAHHVRHEQEGGIGDENRQESEQEIQAAAQDGRAWRSSRPWPT